MLRLTRLQLSSIRALTASALLDTVRDDPGQTSQYYATRYFGGAQLDTQVTHLFWSELKRFGLVTLNRQEGPSAVPRWYATTFQPRVSRVQRHRAEDEDLSVLREASPPSEFGVESGETSVLSKVPFSTSSEVSIRIKPQILALVNSAPNRELSFYLQQMPSEEDRVLAPAVFKELRVAGELERTKSTTKDAFLWRLADKSSQPRPH